MIKSQIPERKKEKLCISLDYLIAYLDKKEVHKKMNYKQILKLIDTLIY